MASALQKDAEAETALAKEAFKRKDYETAAYGFGRALELHEEAGGEPPEDLHLLHSNHSAALAALGFHEASLAAARQSVALGGASFVKGHYRAALALDALERWDEAQVACQAALAVAPESLQLLGLLQKCQQATVRRTEDEKLQTAGGPAAAQPSASVMAAMVAPTAAMAAAAAAELDREWVAAQERTRAERDQSATASRSEREALEAELKCAAVPADQSPPRIHPC
jgi:tetratricopeptide (TPR) repeat protein